MAATVEFRPAEQLLISIKMPACWRVRMWLAARIFGFGSWVADVPVEIDVVEAT